MGAMDGWDYIGVYGGCGSGFSIFIEVCLPRRDKGWNTQRFPRSLSNMSVIECL